MKKAAIASVMAVIFLVLTLVSPVLAALPTLESVTPNNGTVSPTVTVPVSVKLTGTNFENGSTVQVNGTAGVTVSNVTYTSPTELHATFTIGIGAATGSRTVTVTTSGGTSVETVNFTINAATFTITAPTAINLGVMNMNSTKTGFSQTPGSVSTNVAAWSVAATDKKITNPGFMTKTDPNVKLAHPFQIGKAQGSYSDAVPGITYDTNPAILPFFISQQVATGDAPGAYSIVITFTGSY
jgi:hypothetical protein